MTSQRGTLCTDLTCWSVSGLNDFPERDSLYRLGYWSVGGLNDFPERDSLYRLDLLECGWAE